MGKNVVRANKGEKISVIADWCNIEEERSSGCVLEIELLGSATGADKRAIGNVGSIPP